MKSLNCIRRRYKAFLILLVLVNLAFSNTMVSAQTGTASASATTSNATPGVGEQIEVTITIDVSAVSSPDHRLGSFSATLDWDPTVLAYNTNTGILAGFSGLVNTANASAGLIYFNGAQAAGATGSLDVLRVTFDVIGTGSSVLDLDFSAMAAAYTFADLLPVLTVSDGLVQVGTGQFYSLTIAVDPYGAGITDPDEGLHSYPSGSLVNISTNPNPNYEFDHWSGACTGSGACQVTMNSDKSVTAHFNQLPHNCYLLTLSHTGQGSSPLASPTSSTGCPAGRYQAGELISLYGAAPHPGWQITGWTGTSNNNANTSTNSLYMPAGDHSASVIYKTQTYLPLIVNSFSTSQAGFLPPPLLAGNIASMDTLPTSVSDVAVLVSENSPDNLPQKIAESKIIKPLTQQSPGNEIATVKPDFSLGTVVLKNLSEQQINDSARIMEKHLPWFLPAILFLGLLSFLLLRTKKFRSE